MVRNTRVPGVGGDFVTGGRRGFSQNPLRPGVSQTLWPLPNWSDYHKNWHREVKLYAEFENRGLEISTHPHFPQLPTIISLPICHHIGNCGWLQILGCRFLNSPYNFTSRYQFLEKSNNIKGYFWPRATWWYARGACPGWGWYTEKLNATYT